MKINEGKWQRRSIRLPDWDYTSPAVYFVTICTFRRDCLFENEAFYEIAANALQRVPKQAHAKHVELGTWVIMPNHVHVIFVFTDYPERKAAIPQKEGLQNAAPGSLGVVVGRYKTTVTIPINNLRHTKGTSVWQRGYYERIIRNERELHATQKYIVENPTRWAEDRDNLYSLVAKMTYHR